MISPSGKVVKAQVTASELKEPVTEGCIENKILTWTFPQPKGGGVVRINYPIVLKRQ